MADFVSHDLLGEQALALFPAAAQRAAALRPAAYRWGLQGPDPLFFHKVYAGSPLHKTGNRLHSEKTDELFTIFAEAVHRLTGAAHEIAEAYFYGFLCHYALDSSIHPYVYCRQYECIQAMPKENASAIHCRIETDIDTALYAHFKGGSVTEFDPTQAYALTDEETAVLAVLLHHIIRRAFGQDVPTAELRPCFAEMLACQKLFYSGSRPLSGTARRAELLLARGPLLSSHLKGKEPQWDCLNEARKPWCNLWKPEEERIDTVIELFEAAKLRAASLAVNYAAQFDSGWMLNISYYEPFDYGNYKALQ